MWPESGERAEWIGGESYGLRWGDAANRSNLGVREPRKEIPQLPSPLLLVKPKGASGCRLCRPGSRAQSRVEEGGKGSRGQTPRGIATCQ